MKHYYRYLFLLFTLFLTIQISAQTTIWRDIHKVKKKETIFGIAKDYGVSIQELIDANPEMKDTSLKKEAGSLYPMLKRMTKNTYLM